MSVMGSLYSTDTCLASASWLLVLLWYHHVEDVESLLYLP